MYGVDTDEALESGPLVTCKSSEWKAVGGDLWVLIPESSIPVYDSAKPVLVTPRSIIFQPFQKGGEIPDRSLAIFCFLATPMLAAS
jgi:hypothetical protein